MLLARLLVYQAPYAATPPTSTTTTASAISAARFSLVCFLRFLRTRTISSACEA